MQKEILAKNPAAGLRVYALWFNMLYTDARSEWPQHLLNDPRVVHLWDEKKIVGQWAARQVATYWADLGLLPRNVLWDAYLLYAPEARWNDSPSHLISWGRTIIKTREKLRKHLRRVFGEGAASLAVMATVMRGS